MKLPSGEVIKTHLFAALAGAVIIVAVGFNLFGYGFGWTLGGTADKRVEEAAATARMNALLPVCAESFREMANAGQRDALMKADSWKREDFIAAVVQIPGVKKPDSALLRECADAIVAAATAKK